MIRAVAIGVAATGTIGTGLTCVLAQQHTVQLDPMSSLLVQGGFATLSAVLIILLVSLVRYYRSDVKELLTQYHEEATRHTEATLENKRALSENTAAVKDQTSAADSWRRHLEKMKEEATRTAEEVKHAVRDALEAAGKSCDARWEKHIEAVTRRAGLPENRE